MGMGGLEGCRSPAGATGSRNAHARARTVPADERTVLASERSLLAWYGGLLRGPRGTVWLVARVAALVPPCGPGQASAGREPRLAQDQDDRQDQQHRAEGDQGVADAGQLERAADTD
jgi:hypothetical protein